MKNEIKVTRVKSILKYRKIIVEAKSLLLEILEIVIIKSIPTYKINNILKILLVNNLSLIVFQFVIFNYFSCQLTPNS
jgi:hypothetical protein